MAYSGQWHGQNRYFGLHYDLHANKNDTELGTQATVKNLVPMFKRLGVDFVQTDCKGHPGYTSWFSQVPNASVSPGVKRDALKGWREATQKLNLPLHCHYSGIWDQAAGQKHPDWGAVDAKGNPRGAAIGTDGTLDTPERMCPRSPYLDELLIPQLKELIDRYHVNGFWIDGDVWAVEPCYCPRCRTAFAQQTGITTPPETSEDAHWTTWISFTRQSFEDYVTRYCNAVHAHKPGVLVCSNWLQTFHNPGEPKVPTDWISGDNTWVFGLDGCRCESRFISTRGKPWDVMIWSFYAAQGMGKVESPWTFKPVEMLQQEAALVLSHGGNVQIYENPGGLRDGQLVPWRVERLRQVGKFIKARRMLCQNTESVLQVAVLHSEHHVYSQPGANLRRGVDTRPVQGAVYSLLENHYHVDILDEWALLPRLNDFEAIVAPEQNRMSAPMVEALKNYVARGGRLLVSGADALDRFGSDFLGAKKDTTAEKTTFHVPAADGSLPVYSDTWQLLKKGKTQPLGLLASSPLLDKRLTSHPAAVVNTVGQGKVCYVPFDLFRYIEHNRYPLARAFVGQAMTTLSIKRNAILKAPTCVDMTLRKKGKRLLVHLINRASGIPNRPNDGTVDEIPHVGPIHLRVRLKEKPKSIKLAFEKNDLTYTYQRGWLTVHVPDIHIHAAIVIDPSLNP